MVPSPAKQGLTITRRDLVEVTGRRGIRTECQTHRGGVHPQRLWTPVGKSWAVTDTDLVGSLSGWRVGQCERPGARLERQT